MDINEGRIILTGIDKCKTTKEVEKFAATSPRYKYVAEDIKNAAPEMFNSPIKPNLYAANVFSLGVMIFRVISFYLNNSLYK